MWAYQMPDQVNYHFHHWIYRGNAWLDNYHELDYRIMTYAYDALNNLTGVTDALTNTTVGARACWRCGTTRPTGGCRCGRIRRRKTGSSAAGILRSRLRMATSLERGPRRMGR